METIMDILFCELLHTALFIFIAAGLFFVVMALPIKIQLHIRTSENWSASFPKNSGNISSASTIKMHP
jgi:hypothetical protein